MKTQKLLLVLFVFITISIGLKAQTVLKADGHGDTYELISGVLAPGYFPLEVPDCSHPDFGRHIDEVWDSTLNEYVFRFYMHVTPDNDRCINTDRQRNEIKVYDKSPDNLKAFQGDSMVFSWKFKLDSLFQPSYSFTHIHQLKAVGGTESKMPLITFTPRLGNPSKLQIMYAKTSNQQPLTSASLSLFKGSWIKVIEKVRFAEHGSYEVQFFRLPDSTLIFHYQKKDIRMWRTNASFIRPKWGIYRSLNHPDQLRDEILLFNDFIIRKVSALSVSKNEDANFTIFPNPAGNFIHIQSKDRFYLTGIYNSQGILILKPQNGSVRKISIQSLPKGLYFLVFKTGEKHYIKKFIKL